MAIKRNKMLNIKLTIMKNMLLFLLFALILSSCSELDNYAEPDSRLTGEVIDKYPDAQNYYFWGKADGTFNNSKMFAATYEVTPVEGPFITPKSEIITVKGTATVRFEVIPYLVISADKVEYSTETKVLHVKFKVSRPQGSNANPTFAFVALTWNPNVSYNTVGTTGSGLLSKKNITSAELDDILSFDIDISSLTPNHTWYVRMGCGSDKNSSRFNYSNVHMFEY